MIGEISKNNENSKKNENSKNNENSNIQKCKLCSQYEKKAIMSAKFAHELKNIFIMISTIVSDTNKKRGSFESLVYQESGILSPFRFDRGRQNQNDLSMDVASINVEDTDAKFSFLKSLCDYGKSLIKEMNKIFLEENNPKCELFYVSDVIDFCVKMFKFKKYREGKKFKIRSDIKFSYNKAINSINETALKMVLINLLTNAYKFTEQGEIVVTAVEIPERKKIYICVKDTGIGFDVNEFQKKGIFSKYEKNEKYNTDGSGLGMEIVQDVLKKFNSELNFHSDPKYGGTIFYFELIDTYPYNDFIDLKKIMPYSIKKVFDDINNGKTDLFSDDNKTSDKLNDSKNISNTVSKEIQKKKFLNKRNSFAVGNISSFNNKNQIKELFNTAFKQSKTNNSNIKGIINLKKVGCEEEKPLFLETVLKKPTIHKNKSKKNVNILKKNKTNVPTLDFKNLEMPDLRIVKNKIEQKDQCKTKLDENYDNTEFYILSLRHILEKQKIYNNVNKQLDRQRTYDENIPKKKNKKNNKEKYLSQLKPSEKRINIIICDDEVDVAKAAEEIVKKYYKTKGFSPHVYYTQNGIECLYLIYKLSIIEKQIIKFILMDVEMDVLDGITTCNIIKDNRAINQMVYLLSGDPKDCKADGYCSKPLTEADLKRITNTN
jgi:CheY-like chemotaxis protein